MLNGALDYASLDLTDEYLENVISGNRFQAHEHYSKMGKKVDRLKWGMHASTVNAYYSPNMNEMAFPAGILQPPFFSKDAPMVLNFGAIGAVMGPAQRWLHVCVQVTSSPTGSMTPGHNSTRTVR